MGVVNRESIKSIYQAQENNVNISITLPLWMSSVHMLLNIAS